MQVDDLWDFSFFFEDVERFIKGKAIFGYLEGQNIALSIEYHIIDTCEYILDVSGDLTIGLPLVEVNQLFNRTQSISSEDIDPLMVINLHVLQLIFMQLILEL